MNKKTIPAANVKAVSRANGVTTHSAGISI